MPIVWKVKVNNKWRKLTTRTPADLENFKKKVESNIIQDYEVLA